MTDRAGKLNILEYRKSSIKPLSKDLLRENSTHLQEEIRMDNLERVTQGAQLGAS